MGEMKENKEPEMKKKNTSFTEQVSKHIIHHKLSLRNQDDQSKLEMMREINKSRREKKLSLQNDMICYSILCMYKPNVEKFHISPQTQAKVLQNAFLTLLVQFTLTICIYWEIFDEMSNYYKINNQTFKLYVAKFVTTFAMHLLIFQEFTPALKIMKYTIYHPHNMAQPGMAIFLSIMQMVGCFLFELINIQILFSRANVYFTISSYITVDLLKGFGKFYFNAIEKDNTNLLVRVMLPENSLEVSVRGKHFREQPMPTKQRILRICYNGIKQVYASVFFYFVPFLYIVLQA